MTEVVSWGAAVAALPGVVALIGAAVGYGKLVQRLEHVEQTVAKLSDLGDKVTRIDERTLNMKENIDDMKGSVDRLVSSFHGEEKGFAPPARRRAAPS